MPKIKFMTPEGDTSFYDLEDEKYRIGRAPDNDIILNDGSISSYHAEFNLQEGGDYELIDLGSTNGTTVNNNLVEKAMLYDGIPLQLGSGKSFYESENAPPEDAEPKFIPKDDYEPEIGQSSARPVTFESMSPFGEKKKASDTGGKLLLFMGVCSILLCLFAMVMIARMSA